MTLVKRSAKMSPYEGDGDVEHRGTEEANGSQSGGRGSCWGRGGGCNYSCAKANKTIGSYTFSPWTLDASCTGQGYSGGYEGTFSPDLPLPIYLKVGSTSEGSSNYFEYTLTDLKL